MDTSHKLKILLLASCIVLIMAIVVAVKTETSASIFGLLLNRENKNDDQVNGPSQEDSVVVEVGEPDEVKARIQDNENTRVFALQSASDQIFTNTAYVLTAFTQLDIYFTANLPFPAESKTFYQAWLKNPATGDTIPLAVLNKETLTNYAFAYTSQDMHEGYSVLLITLEEEDDEISEVVLLEGAL